MTITEDSLQFTAGHIWIKSAQPWFEFDSAEILWDEQPTDYEPIMEKFRTQVTFEEQSR